MIKICGVYEILNKVNDKRYIGQSVNIYKRWKQHKNKLNENAHRNSYLQNSWNKYGEENFKFSILCECSIEDLDDNEKKYICKYNTCDRKYGFNIDNGGNSNKTLSEETKEKIRQSRLAENLSAETRKRMSESAKKRCTPEWRAKRKELSTNQYVSEETKEKHRVARLGCKHSDETKQKIRKSNMKGHVLCVELGIEFECAKDAGIQLGIGDNASGRISACCNGKRKTCGGYHWEYID